MTSNVFLSDQQFKIQIDSVYSDIKKKMKAENLLRYFNDYEPFCVVLLID